MTYTRNLGAYTQDEQNALVGNPLDLIHQLSASGAIDPHTPARYIITKGGSLAALTLGAPTPIVEDGLRIAIRSNTAFAHTITMTGLLQDGAGHSNQVALPAQAGASVEFEAFNGKWNIVSSNGSLTNT